MLRVQPVKFHSVCVRRMKYSSSQPASEKMIRLLAYAFQSWPLRRVDPHDPVQQALRPPEHRIQERRSPVYTAAM